MPSSIKNSSGGNSPITGVSVRKSDGTWQSIYDAFVKAADGTWKRFLAIVPNVIGQTRTNANSSIVARGLVVGTQTASETTNASLDQQIISTTPAANAAANPGSSVDYTYYNYVAPPYFPPYFPPPYFPPPCFCCNVGGHCNNCDACVYDSCGNYGGCLYT